MFRRGPSATNRPGTATVEFAIIAPILVTLTMGMMEVTRVAQVKNYLTDTARSGCRLAIESGSTNSSVTSTINAILTANGIDSSKATVTVQVNGVTADASTARKYDQVSVKIQLPISSVSWVSALFFTTTSVTSESLTMMHH